jgi:hypothetical protein
VRCGRLFIVVTSLTIAACGGPAANPPAAQAPPGTATAPPSSSAVPHGDHNPHHGGVVMMKGEMHYEVVLDASGRAHHVYFSDAVREELPASIATGVVLTIRRPSAPEEAVTMHIDETGESWVGNGDPVATPQRTTARVAFTIDGAPYWIDLPFAAPSPPAAR